MRSVVSISGLWHWSLEFGHSPKGLWSDTEIVQDGEVAEETSGGLDDTDLEVSEGDEFGVDEMIKFGLSWGSVHDIKFWVLVSERDGWDHIGTKIDTENENG